MPRVRLIALQFENIRNEQHIVVIFRQRCREKSYLDFILIFSFFKLFTTRLTIYNIVQFEQSLKRIQFSQTGAPNNYKYCTKMDRLVEQLMISPVKMPKWNRCYRNAEDKRGINNCLVAIVKNIDKEQLMKNNRTIP